MIIERIEVHSEDATLLASDAALAVVAFDSSMTVSPIEIPLVDASAYSSSEMVLFDLTQEGTYRGVCHPDTGVPRCYVRIYLSGRGKKNVGLPDSSLRLYLCVV